MIVYGWNSKVLKESPFPNHTCESCDSTNSFVVVSASYAHIFWIPLFPYKKKLDIVCGSCGLDTKPKYVSEEVKQLAKKLKSSVRIPFYLFSGVGVIGALVIYLIINGSLVGQKMEEFLQEPQANDIYFLYDKTEPTEFKHYLWKAREVKGDTVYITYNGFSYNKRPDELKQEDGFYNISVPMHKSALLKLYEQDELRTVQRGYDFGTGFGKEIELTEEDLQSLENQLQDTTGKSKEDSN